MENITDGRELIDSAYYAAHGPPHEIWARLRAESPVHRCEPAATEPFWAITKHEDICEISTRPDLFLNRPGVAVLPERQEDAMRDSKFGSMRSIINMDPPEHRAYRKVAAREFTPRAVRDLDELIETSAREIVDELAGETGEGTCDFATDVAARHPLRVLSHMLGVPREQEADILRITNQLFAFDDPELRRSDDFATAMRDLAMEAFEMFDAVIEDRRACPRHDLATVLATGTVDGEPMGVRETLGYYLIVFSAGHDTTKNALVGGMHAFVEHPEELVKLRADPALVDKAVEEVTRWTSPVNYMKRTAAVDTEIRGQRIAAGDALALFYGSANRDEDAFEDPSEFRIDRQSTSRNLGFGIGEHFCLGANLARRSQRALWLELGRRLDWAELAGEPERTEASFVIGMKHLPIRYRLRAA
ncbi:MAG: cytochrome P450 [Acidimicrobiales bacterium]|nr:cytochrome P450 [Acidimicrobiales bacterium]